MLSVKEVTALLDLLKQLDQSLESSSAAFQRTFLRADHRIVIAEGLYLLHEHSGWAGTAALFDVSYYIRIDVDACVARLKIRNRCIPGYTPDEIDIRCDAVDRVNAEMVALDGQRADFVVDTAVVADPAGEEAE